MYGELLLSHKSRRYTFLTYLKLKLKWYRYIIDTACLYLCTYEVAILNSCFGYVPCIIFYVYWRHGISVKTNMNSFSERQRTITYTRLKYTHIWGHLIDKMYRKHICMRMSALTLINLKYLIVLQIRNIIASIGRPIKLINISKSL